ncbi:MAG: hypothetical protein VB118_08255 [Oscillospiraceae bacterium]|nr:hypothetical protein [Oscillospiraceae bacterium]
MKKHITALLSIVLITAFLLASCAEIETDTRLPGNMVNGTNIGTVDTVSAPQTDISDTETIFETGKETAEKPFVWVTNAEKVKYLMPDIEYRGEEYWCSHYDYIGSGTSFHNIPGILMDYLNLTENKDWDDFIENKVYKRTYKLDECDYSLSIYDVIHWIDIPLSELKYIYYNSILMYSMDWNFDVLYAEDISEADKYYNYKNNYNKIVYRTSLSNELWHKLALCKLASKKDNDKLNKILENSTAKIQHLTSEKHPYKEENMKFSFISIPEYIYAFDITREEFEAAFRDDSGFVFTYDLDRIYNQKDELMKQISAAKTLLDIYNIDASLRLDG